MFLNRKHQIKIDLSPTFKEATPNITSALKTLLLILAPYRLSNKCIDVEYAEGPTLIIGSMWPHSNIHAGWWDNKMMGIISEDFVNQTNMSLAGKLDPKKLQMHFRRCWYRYQREMNEFLLSSKIK